MVQANSLTSIDEARLELDGTGTFPTAQITDFTHSDLIVSGFAPNLTGLTNLTGSGFIATDGAVVTLPTSVTQYVGSNKIRSPELRAEGVGSRIDLSGVTQLEGATFPSTSVRIQGLGGGVVDLSNLQQVTGGGISIVAEGTDSRVEVQNLTRLLRTGSNTGGVLRARDGGVVQANSLTSIEGARIELDGTGVFPTRQISSFVYSDLVASGFTPNLIGIADATGSGFTARDGAQISLPAVTHYSGGDRVRFPEFRAEGRGSVLNASGIGVFRGTTFPGTSARVSAFGGGFVNLSQVNTAFSGGLRVEAEDPGSEIALTNLQRVVDAGGGSSVFESNAGGLIRLSGTVPADVNEGIVIGVGGSLSVEDAIDFQGTRLINYGSLEAAQEGTIDLGLSLEINGSSRIASAPSGTIEVGEHLLGDSRNADLFDPNGIVVLDGNGTADSPQFLEVMGRDFGEALDGFSRNFVYGTLALDEGTYVQLVDLSDNSPGNDPEALYVDSIIVPEGTTLDLDGLNVYVRGTVIEGTVLGGAIIQISDSGPIPFDTSVSGTIGLVGEIDEWEFFGSAGQSVTVSANPTNRELPAPLIPFLGSVEATLIDANDNVLAIATSTNRNELVTLLDVVLPADGMYRILIHAPDEDPSLTGNYVAGLWNATPDISPLTLGERLTGRIENPYSVDRWTFSAMAGQQVLFDLINVSNSEIVFDLAGPDGWMGFVDLDDDFEPITLPSSGNYTLTARGTGGFSGGNYAFQLLDQMPTDLTLGVDYVGTLAGTANSQLFRVTIPEGETLRIELDGDSDLNRNELYARIGSPPTRRTFDASSLPSTGANQEVLVPLAAPGTWFILLYGAQVSSNSNFTLKASTQSIVLSEVTPDRSGTGVEASMTVTGGGFLPGSFVELVSADATEFSAASVEVAGYDRLIAALDLAGVPEGLYDVRVTVPGVGSEMLEDAFTVLPAGEANLETNLILPSAMGFHANSTIYVEYANTGTVAMPAPILILQSNDPEGDEHPIMTLDQSRLIEGFWTSANPDGFSRTVQIYASGEMPGILAPGERMQIPVYFVGMERPWNLGDRLFEFEIRIHEAGSTDLIDWPAIQTTLQPGWIADDAWAAIAANLETQIGSTWGDYVETLGENATYLGRLGQRVTDIADLYGFEMLQAIGLSMVPTLESVVDASVPGPGLPLSFGRSFGNTIVDRYDVGPFGRGWTAPWQTSLDVLPDGTVVVRQSARSQRRFQPDERRIGRYFSQEGDTGTLSQVGGGAFELAEANGQVTRFRPDGTLEYVEDTNGNRITTTFTGGLLSRLDHSGGNFLTIDYNSAGLIERITDSYGRETIYGYDAANEHLLEVTGPGGTTTYGYSIGQGIAREHALTSITDPSGVARYFEYDELGRIDASYLTGGAERVDYSYSPVGDVISTDGVGTSTEVSFDHRGLVLRVEDTTGAYLRYEYDDERMLYRVTDALGRSQSFTWTETGALASVTDPLGHTTTFVAGGPDSQPLAFIDAKKNRTSYDYDDAGNLKATTYPDGSVERVAYDAIGNPIQLVNRRGQVLGRRYNAAGQLVEETFPDAPTVTYDYDPRGQLWKATDARGTTEFTYDNADRLQRVAYPSGRWIEYTYDDAGRRIRMVDHTGFVVAYRYDASGRLEELRDADGRVIVTYRYDTAGRLEREDKGNETYSIYAYDAVGRVDRITHFAPDGSINSFFDYAYDAVGRRVGAETTEGEWTYRYDLVGQLVGAVFASTNPDISDQDLVYEYDALGNRVRVVFNGEATDYAVNTLNQYNSAGTTTFEYDMDGNLVVESGPDGLRSFSYDSRNRLVSVETPQGMWIKEYDVFGNRSALITDNKRTEYLINLLGTDNVIGEYDAMSARTLSHSHGFGLESTDRAAGRTFYDFDTVGSTVGLSGKNGKYLNRYLYMPFGDDFFAVEELKNTFKFVGKYGVSAYENTMASMGVRNYSFEFGRFHSQDPLNLSAGDNNLYRYAINNPNEYIDPSGLYIYKPSGFAGTVIQAGAYYAGFENPSGTAWGLLQILFGLADIGTGVLALGAPGSGWILGAAQIGGGFQGIAEGFNDVFPGKPDVDEPPPGSYRNPKEPPPPPNFFPDPPPPPLEPPTEGGDSGGSDQAGASDPNEKLGQSGFGQQAFVSSYTVIPYRINFENLGPGSDPLPARPATAPAQRVVITDQLSADLDWSTLRFTGFGFGDTFVAVPDGRKSYFATVPMQYNGRMFDVEVELAFDPGTGLVRTVFQSVDPTTSLPPDVLTGFLPPEDGTGRGQGYIAFTIRPRAGLPTGTELRNVAVISFDGQTVIATNQVDPQDPSQGTSPDREALNTIDAAGPTSAVNALTNSTTDPTFTVTWSGADDPGGSGIGSYDLYVSIDEGPFTPFLLGTTETSITFPGEPGRKYAFYTIARDNVGYIEDAPLTPDAMTTVESTLTVDAGSNRTSDEGVEIDLPGAQYFYNGNLDDLTLHVDWGDETTEDGILVHGDGGGTVANTHTYDDNDTYTITLTLFDGQGNSVVSTLQVVVDNVDPTATLTNGGDVDEGSTGFVQFSAPFDPSAADVAAGFSYSYDFDNDDIFEITQSGSASAVVPASFLADGPAIRTIRARISDKDGGFSDYTTSIAVTNVSPTVESGSDITINEGGVLTRSGSFVDPGADAWTATVDYGDGSGEQPLMLDPDKSFSLDHTYRDDGTYVVTVRVRDDDEAEGMATFNVTVLDIAPVITAPSGQTAEEGTSRTFLRGSFSDPGADNPWTVSVDWGDESTVSSFPTSSVGSLGSQEHVYDDDGTYTVTVSVSDKDGVTTSKTFQVLVVNIAPTISSGGDATIDEGSTLFRSGFFTDPGADTWTATVDYGDGSGEQPLALEPDKTFQLDHTYAIAGTYTVVVTVTDDDESATTSFAVMVDSTAVDPPTVTEFVVNEGDDQRSNVDVISLSFDQEVNIQDLIESGAIVDTIEIYGLANDLSETALSPSNFLWNPDTRTLLIDLTIDGFGGSARTLLADDNYEVRLHVDDIRNRDDTPLDDSDGVDDGMLRFAFHRLEGDFDGDKDVDVADRADWFDPTRVIFGARIGEDGYSIAYDYDGDGMISSRDYYYWLRQLYGRRLP